MAVVVRPAVAFALFAFLLAAPSKEVDAIGFSGFGTHGQGGDLFGETLTIGPGGAVNLLDAWVAVGGAAATTLAAGATVQLATFETFLSGDATDLTLRYTLENTSGATATDVRFFSVVDAEIDESVNGFFNEFGTVLGTAAAGQGWEIDELGFAGGNLIANVLGGALEDTNDLPAGSEDDVAMALAFAVGDLDPGAQVTIEVLLSEDGDQLDGIALRQGDADVGSTTEITFSGQVVPEPSLAALLGSLLLASAARRR